MQSAPLRAVIELKGLAGGKHSNPSTLCVLVNFFVLFVFCAISLQLSALLTSFWVCIAFHKTSLDS